MTYRSEPGRAARAGGLLIGALGWVFVTGPAFAVAPDGDAASEGEVAGGKCVPAERCCRICEEGKACGDSCIRKTFNCHKGHGCACNQSEVCGDAPAS
jgi:hypothetical protein